MVAMPPASVMVVEDEENVRYVTSAALRLAGFGVAEQENGRLALRELLQASPEFDLVVLDVMLPDLDGLEVCRRLREEKVDVPIVFLTARDERADRIHGLTLGGDDYLTKPFSVEELVARVRAVLRRAGKEDPAKVLRSGLVELDEDSHVVRLAAEPVALSPTEYSLLRVLLRNKGRAMTRAQILDYVWSYDFAGEPSVVEQFVSSLRRKVDPTGSLITTVRGYGYRLEV
jgi:two-component system OmpR family response regulator